MASASKPGAVRDSWVRGWMPPAVENRGYKGTKPALRGLAGRRGGGDA